MSKFCPIYGKAIYMDCLECDVKLCRKERKSMSKYKTICIGIDQSYKNTGVSISADNKLRKVAGIELLKCKSNSEKRKMLQTYLRKIASKMVEQSEEVVCVIERIRLRSQGFLNIDYIKSIGALNAVIVDVMHEYGIEVYSVDTRCWKAQVVGTSKPMPNKYGVPDEKWPTVNWVCELGFEESILIDMTGSRKSKGTFIEEDGKKYMYDNDRADSAAISLFWFRGESDKLKVEK